MHLNHSAFIHFVTQRNQTNMLGQENADTNNDSTTLNIPEGHDHHHTEMMMAPTSSHLLVEESIPSQEVHS